MIDADKVEEPITFRERMKSVNKKMEELRVIAEKSPKRMKEDIEDYLGVLHRKKLKIMDLIDSYEGASNRAIDDLSEGIEMAWEDLNLAYESAKDTFEKEVKNAND